MKERWPFQILSLSGGGFLGLYTACVLEEIELLTGRPLGDTFDLIAGTSVGGIIGLGLSAGTSATEIKQAFLDEGHKIFSPNRPSSGAIRSFSRFITSLPQSRYDPTPLRSIIERIVAPARLMSDLRRPTIVTAVNLTKGGPKVFKTGHHPSLFFDWKLPIAEVALATSAAPTYFPIHQIGSELFADGGMYANSPDLIALHEAETFLNARRENIRVLSVGTTTTAFAFSASTERRLGSWGWMKSQRLPTVMIGCQQAVTHEMMKHIMSDRYIRIDHSQSPEQEMELALDCASPAAKKNLMSAAKASVAQASSSPALRSILSVKVPQYRFENACFGKET